jgi:hypothetical protein
MIMLTPVRFNGTRLFSFLAFVVFWFIPGCSGPPKHATWSNATGAEQYERLMWETAHSKDWNAFGHRLAPTFIGVDSSGKAFDRMAWVERWKNARLGAYSLGEVAVQPEGVDMVVSYILDLAPGGTGNADSGERLRVVSVWQQVKAGWIQTACSMTPIKAE